MSLGPSEIVVVLLVALIVLGPDKLPQAARTFGKYLAEFRKFSASVQAQVDDALKFDQAEKQGQGPSFEEKTEGESGPKPPNPDVSGFSLIDGQQQTPPTTPDKDREA